MFVADEEFFIKVKKQNSGELLFKNVKLVCYTKERGNIYVDFSGSAIETDIKNYPDYVYIGREIY